MTAHVVLDNVSVMYDVRKALEDISGFFAKGSLTAVAGPNGAGKSTLLKVIAGLVKPCEGTVMVAQDVMRHIGYLPQASALPLDYPLSVFQVVTIGLWPLLGERKKMNPEKHACVHKALAQVGLAGFEDRQLGALSGGEFQKLLFARLVLQNPSLILLDEPFAAIDATTTTKLMEVLLSWHQKGKTIICVLHDLLLIKKYFPQSFVLSGKCLGRGHTHKLFEENLLSFDLDMAEIRAPEEIKENV